MIGPFDKSLFATTHINSIGIAARKYSGKKHLIIDLSTHHNNEIQSISSLIPLALFCLCYASVGNTISQGGVASRGSYHRCFQSDAITSFAGASI